MLSRLSVSNLAIVEKAEADFASGLNVLTGETGAGKSVLMGALELVLGGRADSAAVREGAREARVEATFSLSGGPSVSVAEILAEAGLPSCEDGEFVVRRTVAASGGGRVWVNDAVTTVATLRRLGRVLVDIHGPRANQNVLEEKFQRETLDAVGEVSSGAVARRYSAAWTAYCAKLAERDDLLGASASADELDLLRYQVGELSDADITASDENLAERHAAAAHAAEIVGAANEITEALGGDGGAADILGRLQPTIAAAARHFPAAEEWAAEAETIAVRIQELSRSVADAASGIDADPAAFEELDARLAVVNRLKRKYGDGLLDVLAAKRARLGALENREVRLAALEQEVAAALADVTAAGAALTKARKAAAAKLAKAVTRELHDLGFLQAKFSVDLTPSAPEAHGCDRVTYVLAPNPGEPARPLAEIASSGETARVMLALKAVVSAHDATDVLVFDEIDANIGGETGSVVGAKMRAVARDHQVIAITHLPQCAAYAARHLVVSKSVGAGRTRTNIAEVSGEARAKEIARMLGGERSTSVALRHAEELIARAERASEK